MSPPPHIALLMSPRRFTEERHGVRRLATGLLADGASVTIFEPEIDVDPDMSQPTRERVERRFELPRRVPYAARVPFWLRRARVDRMTIACERSTPDLVWCCGADAWDLATQLGVSIDRPVVLDFRSNDDLRRAPRAIRSDHVVALAAPCAALAGAARRVVPEPLVRLVPLGVRMLDALAPATDAQTRREAASVVTILTEGRSDAAIRAALAAVRSETERRPELLALVECDARSDARIWRAARELDMLRRITAVERGHLTAAAIEACDLLLLPEPHGGPRVEALLALGRNVPIVAASDPFADTLIDGETAVLLASGTGHDRAWADAVAAALEHPEQARKLASRGRQLVLSRHRSSMAAQQLLATAEELVAGGPLRFSPQPS
ncbi:MAG: glycosyltransferase [Phycisphaerales bacterium]